VQVGSDGDGRPGLCLVIPVVTLLVPLVLLVLGLFAQPAPMPAPLQDSAAPLAADVDLLDQDVAALPEGAPEAVTDSDLMVAAEPVETPVAVAVTPLPTPVAVRPTPTPRVVWNGPRTFTFVLLGVDRREDNEIPRTDTIIVGKLDLSAPRVNLISVPRDLLVDIPGYGNDRINTAYVYGEQFKEPDGGIGLLRRTIQKNFGVSVDHFGLIDFQCFRTAVDAVGGISINVPRAIVDTQYPTDDYGYKLVKFDPGWQRMDGERALEYARTRHADSDFQRIQRQQLIMAALRDQVLQLRSLPALPAIFSGCRNMRSDLTWLDYVDLASSLRNLDRPPIVFGSIDQQMVVDTTLSTGAAVLVPRWPSIRSLFASAFGTSVTPTTASGPARAAPSPSPLPVPPASGVASSPRSGLPDDDGQSARIAR
jgi:LCP family protein required for cell wall assembly